MAVGMSGSCRPAAGSGLSGGKRLSGRRPEALLCTPNDTFCLWLVGVHTPIPLVCPPADFQAALASVRDERKQLSKEAGLAADAELAHQRYECSQVRVACRPFPEAVA